MNSEIKTTRTKKTISKLQKLTDSFDTQVFQTLNEEISYSEYLDKIDQDPRIVRTAFQRMYDMIMSAGHEQFERYRKTLTHYNFFDDPTVPIFGLEPTLDEFVKFIKGAAGNYGTEKRVLLFHGPVGSAKSTICRLLKRGLERYSRTDQGAWYSYRWVDLPTEGEPVIASRTMDDAVMHEEPLKLLPQSIRQDILNDLNEKLRESTPEANKNSLYTLRCDGELNPRCKLYMRELLRYHGGNLYKVLDEHIVVVRKVYSEADRVGIATFQPKDEKNQDATELTGDINYHQISHWGSDSDPRAFNFDGEFCFPVGFPVRMADGTEKFVEQVIAGDDVVTHTGNSRKVLKTFSRSYTGEMVTVQLAGFCFPITMTKDHPVATIAGRCNWRWQPGDLVWKPAGELTEDDRLVIGWNKSIKKTRENIDFKNLIKDFVGDDRIKIPYAEHKNSILRHLQVSPSFARLIGLYLAEGGCTKKKLYFYFSAEEEHLAKEVIDLMRGIFGVGGSYRKVNIRKSAIIVEFNNINLVRVFKHFVPGNVYSKRVPSLFFDSDEQVKIALILGWIDGDGYKAIRNKQNKPSIRIVGVTASKNLARDMSVLSLSCGIVAAVSKRAPYKQSKEAYSVGLSGKKILKNIPLLASEAKHTNITLWDKDNNITDFGYVRKIKKIITEDVCDTTVYDFEVEEDHSFLVNDIAVHNCVGNRGMVEFIEMLKLQQEFLYDLLEATQDHSIKPKKYAKVAIDEILIGHTNNPEYERLRSNDQMEALRDRTIKIDVPYLLRWSDELKVLTQDYGPEQVRQHVAPHTLEMAALWAVMTRLEEPREEEGIKDLVEKAKLYDDKYLPGWTEDKVKELRDKYKQEGMERGISARYTQDKISNCLSDNHSYINPFMVLNELKSGLRHYSLITKEEDRARYETCIELAIKEYGEIVKTEVQKALVADEKAIIRLCANYIDNVMADIKKAKIRNKFTGEDQEPDERLMRAIEEKIDIPAVKANDFRQGLAAYIGDLAISGETFHWNSNPDLKKALEMKLFEDVKDHVKLSALSDGASVVDQDNQKKIDLLKRRLVTQYGYNEQSATDVLEYVGGIFARGDINSDE